MPAVKHPCLQCKEKHVKCDDQRPQCRRCQSKLLPCTRPAKQTVFRGHPISTKTFKGQKWVSSSVKRCRLVHFHQQAIATPLDRGDDDDDDIQQQTSGSMPLSNSLSFILTHDQEPSVGSSSIISHLYRHQADHGPGRDGLQGNSRSLNGVSAPVLNQPRCQSYHHRSADGQVLLYESYRRDDNPSSSAPRHRGYEDRAASFGTQPGPGCFPLEDVQAACLLRYFVEEMSHWFDLCDEQRHFQLIVPVRARRHPHLLNAIFAVAARHLSRLPQYKTPDGILYHGQLLPNLSEHDAVEYMLKCIPALRQFHDVEDDEYRDSIITTAVILRQLEEIDDEEDSAETHDGVSQAGDNHPPPKQVNFLAIINAVLYRSTSQILFGQRTLIQAAYWMALRQEIYHSFTRKQPPQLIPSRDFWQSASIANKTVMHTVEVAKWCWGDGSENEWVRLMDQQRHLERHVLVAFQPIFQRPADKSKGDIFPTMWFGSNIEVTSVQQAIMAKSVLIAENPFLKSQSVSRSTWRKAESDVRMLLLDLCGIALCHPASPPALLNAAIGIQLYGDFFTDRYERQALRGVVERYRDARAWPVQRLLEMFRE